MGIEYPSWVSRKWEEQSKKDAYLKAVKEYDETHVACPQCGSIRVGCRTGMPLDRLHDGNEAWCLKCSWRGIVHDLVAASKPAQK